MRKKQEYMPARDDDFFNFQGNLVDRVIAKAEEWGIPESAFRVLVEKRRIYEPLYHKSQDKKTRTSVDVMAHRRARNEYEKAIRVFVKAYLMFNPNIKEEERVGLGLRLPDREPTPRPLIEDVPVIGLSSMGGGNIEVRCRMRTDQSRPSIHPDADGIEVRYSLVLPAEPPPADPLQCPYVQISTKARFIIQVGITKTGKRFYGFFRWVNLKKAEHSGPYSEAKTIIIS